jgi:hypothetical protein
MTEIEFQLIRDTMKPLVSRGYLSAACIDEIKTLTGNKAESAMPELMTQEEACKYYKCTRQYFFKLRKQNRLKPVNIVGSRMIRYLKTDIQALMQ